MNQPKELKEIWELETLLHRIKGQSNKHQERKVILAKLEELSIKVKDRWKRNQQG